MSTIALVLKEKYLGCQLSLFVNPYTGTYILSTTVNMAGSEKVKVSEIGSDYVKLADYSNNFLYVPVGHLCLSEGSIICQHPRWNVTKKPYPTFGGTQGTIEEPVSLAYTGSNAQLLGRTLFGQNRPRKPKKAKKSNKAL